MNIAKYIVAHIFRFFVNNIFSGKVLEAVTL